LSTVLNRLGAIKEQVSETLSKRSPLERYDDLEPKMRDRFETELDAAIEAEYRRQRTELLAGIEWWFRDVWLHTQSLEASVTFAELAPLAKAVAGRLTSQGALANIQTIEKTQQLLATNVQEALALEVAFLGLKL